jgi:glycyl-tRNA synthetase beta chain
MSHNNAKDFLIEIGTEELPSKSLQQFSLSFAQELNNNLQKIGLRHGGLDLYVTPRRMAARVKNLAAMQQDREVEKTGPSVRSAYDINGNPTAAALGFARSCHVSITEIKAKPTPKGECLYYLQKIPGKKTIEIMPSIIENTLNHLPISRPMRWGNHEMAFIRPVRWILMLYGNEVVPCKLFGVQASNQTFGHRFSHPKAITIHDPAEYEQLLKQGFVIASYEKRKETIRQQIMSLSKSKGKVVVDEDLLDEVTGLVEWPIALLGTFPDRFLKIPSEVVVSAMKFHQKCFPVFDEKDQLLPYFITIANIESKAPEEVITGNEKVIRARLSDAEFFYHTDLKHGIENHLFNLKSVIFQAKLGNMYDKAVRIAQLSEFIANELGCDTKNAARAGLLCKADLTTEMVGEFPELQGIMGYYYALQDQESQDVALAIREHYQPRFSGDALPSSLLSGVVALADKVDTLLGIFGINQAPTGDKDPFALRRAAVGLLRIMIEKRLALDLQELLTKASQFYSKFANAVPQALEFILERLRAWYLEQGISSDIFSAVYARHPTRPFDFDNRIKAVAHFKKLPEAEALALANKRVSNILKQAILPVHTNINFSVLENEAEQELANLIEQKTKEIEHLCSHSEYKKALTALAAFRNPVDRFFDTVLVMTEDEKLRNNRLILLNNLRHLFLQIADVSLLQS